MDKRPSSIHKLDSMHFPPIIYLRFLPVLLPVRHQTSSNNKQRTTPSIPLALSLLQQTLLSLNPPVSSNLNSPRYLRLSNSQRILSLGFRPCPLDSFSHKQPKQIPFAGTLWRHNLPGFRRSVRRTPYSQRLRASTHFRRRMALEQMRSRPIPSRSLGRHPTRSPLQQNPIRSGLSTAVHLQAHQVQIRCRRHI